MRKSISEVKKARKRKFQEIVKKKKGEKDERKEIENLMVK
jgi:hypothetical protein